MTEAGHGLRPARGLGYLPWILLGALWFATAPVRPLLDPDEGRYAEIPREMLASGDWITPRLDDLKYFEKPPLQYWATAAAYSAFGLTEWTARLWTVGLGFLCLPMVFVWTSRRYGCAAGYAALTALAVSPYFELLGHLNLLDAGFTFWLTAALFAFTTAQCETVGSRRERLLMLAAWLAAALAVLSKGIVVGVLVGSTMVLYTLVERDWRSWRRLHAVLGVSLFLLVTLPWLIAVSLRNPSFPAFFFIHEHFARFLTTVHQRVEPWWYFLALLLIGALPWLSATGAAIRRAWFDSSSDINFKPLKFLLLFSAVTLLFFSASESKLAPYVLPIMPPLAAIVGSCVGESQRFIRQVGVVAGALLLVAACGLVVYTMRRNGYLPHSALPWVVAGAVAALAGILGSWKWTPGATRRHVWITAASAILGWQCLLSAYAELPPLRSAHKMLVAVRPLIGPATQLFSVGQYRETIPPYLQRTMPLVQFEGELAFGLAEEPWKILTPEAFLARWKAANDAVVFLNPAILDSWRRRGLQGRVIAQDENTVAVSRL